MSRLAVYTLIGVVGLCGLSARAEVGVTDACQKDIGDLQEKIDDNKDDYTAESRRKAQSHLLAAKTGVWDARARELREAVLGALSK